MPLHGIIYDIQRMSVHDGPGLRTTVFFKGCPLHCLWCSNPESQACEPQLMFFPDMCTGCGHCLTVCQHGAVIKEGDSISRDFSKCTACGECTAQCPTSACSISGAIYDADEVMTTIRKDSLFYSNSGGGVTFGGGECTMQGEFLLAMIEKCQHECVHTCIDTCGYTEQKLFRQVLDMADLLLFDIKHMDSVHHKVLTGKGNEVIQGNLKYALANCPEKIRIRFPLMPNLNDSEENIAATASFLRPYGVNHVDILPCHSFGRNKYEALKLPQPKVSGYTPDDLHKVLQCFAIHGLETEIV